MYITKTYLYNFDPLKPHFYMGFTEVYIIFLISAQKHRLWVLVRTASVDPFSEGKRASQKLSTLQKWHRIHQVYLVSLMTKRSNDTTDTQLEQSKLVQRTRSVEKKKKKKKKIKKNKKKKTNWIKPVYKG